MNDSSEVSRALASALLVLAVVTPAVARSGDTVTPKRARQTTSGAVADPTSITTSDLTTTSTAPSQQTAEAGSHAAGADTDLASRPLIRGDLRTFDVTGFKLGMSPAEAQRVAAAAHLLASDGGRKMPFDAALHGIRGADFRLIVARAAAARLGRPRPDGPTVVTEVLLYGPAGDKYEINFLPMEAGPQLSSVQLFASAKGITPQSFLDAVNQKYGKPPTSEVRTNEASARWCASGDQMCSDLPAFIASVGDVGSSLWLHAGDRALIDLNRRIEAAGAAAAASSAGKPSL